MFFKTNVSELMFKVLADFSQNIHNKGQRLQKQPKGLKYSKSFYFNGKGMPT